MQDVGKPNDKFVEPKRAGLKECYAGTFELSFSSEEDVKSDDAIEPEEALHRTVSHWDQVGHLKSTR
jgi:hypothetical protein